MSANGPQRDDDDGIRIVERRHGRRGATVAALGVAVAALGGLAWWSVHEGHARWRNPVRASATADAPVAGSRSDDPASRAAVQRSTAPSTPPPDGTDPSRDLSDYVLPGEAPDMRTVITALHRRGIRTGLGAFPPPGTRPPLLGLEVPPDFELPPGYVRHHQATDDGQRIAPILMFSPDIDAIDIGGRRVPIPADRVVPPALAPAGMPLKQVRIPPPRDPGP